jgi:hypothetical protein
VPARLFLRTKTPYILKKRTNRLWKIFLPCIALFFGFFIQFQTAHAQENCGIWPRPIDCYKTLWGTDEVYRTLSPEDQKNQIRRGQGNGIAVLGVKTKEQGGYNDAGQVKKLLTVVTLRMDLSKFRGWNMVGAAYCSKFLFITCDFWNNKDYVRFMDDVFIIRIYQKDANGIIINESLTPATAHSFIGGGDDFTEAGDEALLNAGKPLRHIIRYVSGSALFANSARRQEDGYTSDSPSGAAPMSLGGAALTGAAAGSVIPGLGTVAGTIAGIAVNYLLDTSNPVLALGQVALIDADVLSTLKPAERTYAELWYAGTDMGTTASLAFTPAGAQRNEIPPRNQPEGSRVRYFKVEGDIEGNLDGEGEDFPYFQIGPTTEFTTPATAADAATNAADAAAVANTVQGLLKTNDDSFLPACDILNGWRPIEGGGAANGTFLGCIAQLFYYAIYSPIQWFAGIMGKVFDFFLGFSLDDQSYRADFIVTAWKVVRDISNIFFIIILIWTGLAAVFGVENISMKKVIPQLIINALIINFSLFATQVAIDASNIFARIFYNKLNVCKGPCQIDNETGRIRNPADTISGYKSVSVAIVSVFDPQTIFNPKAISLNSAPSAIRDINPDGETVSTLNSEQFKQIRGKSTYATYFILISAVAAAIVLSVAIMFWKVAFFFLGRVVGLYITMIFAPFAFLTRANMPLVGKIGKLKWDDWLGELTNYCLLAPIFVFFLFIVYSIATSPFLQTVRESIIQDGDILPTILSIVVPLGIVYFFIDFGVDLAKKYAGETGKRVQEAAIKAAGYTAGAGLMVASAGAAYAGTTLGARAGKLLGKTSLGSWASRNAGTNRFARKISNTLDWTQKSSWDPRKTKLGSVMTKNPLFDRLGLKEVGSGAGFANKWVANEKNFEGGAIGRAKRKEEAKDMKERITGFSYLSKEQAQKLWEQKQDDLIGKEAMRGYLNEANTEFKKQSDTVKEKTKEIEKLKKDIAQTEKDLKTTNRFSEDQMDAKRKALIADMKKLNDNEKTVRDTKNAQLKTINETVADKSKEKAIRESKKYEKAYDAAKKESDNKFGKIENQKDYENAMRRIYVEDLRENSFWMKDGKQRAFLPALGLSGSLAGFMTKFGTLADMAVGGAASAIFAEQIKQEQEAIDAATKSFIKNYDKGKKNATKVQKYKETVKKTEDLLKEELSKAFEKLDKKKIKPEDIDLDKISLKEQEEKIKHRVEELYAEMEAMNEEYKLVSKYHREGDATKDDVIAASKRKKKAADLYDEVKNLWKNRRDAEDAITKEEESK